MVRRLVGCWVAVWILACGESSPTNEAPGGGSANRPGSSGESNAGGSDSDSKAGESNAGGSSAASSDELPAYFEPGSRLKPKVLAAEGGVDVIEGSTDGGWYDSELEFDCFFAPDDAGTERCFPRELVTGGKMYADADCTRPVLATAAVGTCGGLRYQYFTSDEGGCAYHGFRLGPELPESTPLFVSFEGSCQPSAETDLGPIRELEAMPAETFVRMRREPRPRAPGLDAYVRAGDDGSWQIIGYVDPAREAPCFDTLMASSSLVKCVPAYASSSGFAEPTCQTRVSDARHRACDVEPRTALLVTRAVPDSCPLTYEHELFDIDDIREVAKHQLDKSGACVPSPGTPGESYVQGKSVELATLPNLETFPLGAGKTRALFSGFGGVPYMPVWYGHVRLVDESGEACLPFRFPDGSLRCFPTFSSSASAAGFLYEDASCTGAPVVPWIAKPTCPESPPLPRAVVIPPSMTCELAAAEVFAVVGESNATTLYAKDSMTGECKTAPLSEPRPTYLQLGDLLEASAFPELKRTTRQ